MVQSKIKIEEYARYSRLGTTTNNNTPVRVNSLVPAPLAPQRIHPVQRFSSEGSLEFFKNFFNLIYKAPRHLAMSLHLLCQLLHLLIQPYTKRFDAHNKMLLLHALQSFQQFQLLLGPIVVQIE